MEPLGAAIGTNVGRDLGQICQERTEMWFGQMRDQEVQANEHVPINIATEHSFAHC